MTTVQYYYDLELDEAGEIVGGEWYNNRHPDFLWTPTPEAQPRPYYAWRMWGEWTEGEAVPSSWRWASAEASRYGHLQTKVVNELFRRAAIPLPLPEYPRACKGGAMQAAPLVGADGVAFLEHPGANQTYADNDAQCWRLEGCPAGQSLVLTWDMFDTEGSYDYVSVYTSPDGRGQQVGPHLPRVGAPQFDRRAACVGACGGALHQRRVCERRGFCCVVRVRHRR